MHRSWYAWVAIAIFAVLGAAAVRLQWAYSTPKRPRLLPATAIWVPAPLAPLDFSPRGSWFACWFDAARNVDRCKLTDYKGRASFEADYSPVIGVDPVPEGDLRLKPVNSTMDLWTTAGDETVPIAHLQDGTVLVPTQDLALWRQRYTSR